MRLSCLPAKYTLRSDTCFCYPLTTQLVVATHALGGRWVEK